MIGLGISIFAALLRQQEVPKTIFFGFDATMVSSETIVALKNCSRRSEIIHVVDPKQFTIAENEDGSIFIYKNLAKLYEYIALRKQLLEYQITVGSNVTTRPWTSLPTVGTLPKFYQDYISALSTQTASISLDANQKINPSLKCNVRISVGDESITVPIRMDKAISDSIMSQYESNPVHATSIPKDKIEAIVNDFRDRLAEPSVDYRSDRFTMLCWGPPWANSKMAAAYESYFKRIKDLTLEAEKLVNNQEMEFLQRFGANDSKWKSLSTCPGSKFRDIDSGSKKLILDSISNNQDLMKRTEFSSKESRDKFLDSAIISRCRIGIAIRTYFINSNGTKGEFGIAVP